MSLDPERCSVCGALRPLYKIADKGFCSAHRPAGNWRDEVATVLRIKDRIAAYGDKPARYSIEPMMDEPGAK